MKTWGRCIRMTAAAVLAAAVAIAAVFQRGEELGIGKNTVAGAADEGKIRLELETEAVTRQAIQAAVSAERPNYPQT
ncbi:MAG: hypothetical protein IIU47_08890, partial [Lachnospiraceae bacterium]|nr:hypothetical protein [Lachnospiraceae bacterium]